MKRTPDVRTEAVVEKLVAGGEGLARLDSGEIVFVPRAAPGERVALEIDRRKRPARGRLLKVLTPSPARVEPPCASFDRCGGCDLMHLTPEAQREARLSILREALAKVPLGDVPIAWHAATPAHGRTRARWHAKSIGGDRLLVGYHALGSNTIVAPEACGALDPRLSSALSDARATFAGAKGEGEIHVAVGEGGRPVLSLTWRGEVPPRAFAEAERRVKAGRLAGVEIALAGASTPARIGDPRPVSIADDGLPLRAPPRGFAQASEIGDRVLVQLVLARAEAKGKRVVELFAGSGNFTVALAREAVHVTAVELDAASSKAARDNLDARGIGNVKSIVADADAWALPKDAEVVVLDPPRSGARGAARAIVERKPRRVVYVSCDPNTLARDLRDLSETHSVVAIDAVDLFPDTSHVETVVTLERRR
ncbi:MAG: class I SAM-dependent RNA methyltransferase [Deltaproteobacteria bacterium]|nr:class I SAM-dependent RNA methyltransferase [Deltaproteobacteria bacterium]